MTLRLHFVDINGLSPLPKYILDPLFRYHPFSFSTFHGYSQDSSKVSVSAQIDDKLMT